MEVVIAVLGAAVIGLSAALVRSRRHHRADRDALGAAASLIDPAMKEPGGLDEAIDRLHQRLVRAEHDRAMVVGALTGADLGILIAGPGGAVVHANPAAEQYLGASLGKAVAQVRVRQLIEQVILAGRPEAMDLNLYTPVRRVLRLRARPLIEGGIGAAVYIEDLTEQRRIDAMRRDFVANVSHELKTPLGALTVLADALGDSDDPIVRKRLADRLAGEASRMARLVDDILDLSEVESTRARHAPVDLGEIVAGCGEAMALKAEEAGVTLVLEPPAGNVEVVGDRQQLASVVTNLVENAVKYTAAADRPGEAATVRLRAYRDGGDAVIQVQDEGIGIAERHQQRIFERFYRVDRARSRETGGTGLGLSIVRNVVRNHGGTVDLVSREGVGSTFTVRLPLRGT